jgi:hypothetical protein
MPVDSPRIRCCSRSSPAGLSRRRGDALHRRGRGTSDPPLGCLPAAEGLATVYPEERFRPCVDLLAGTDLWFRSGSEIGRTVTGHARRLPGGQAPDQASHPSRAGRGNSERTTSSARHQASQSMGHTHCYRQQPSTLTGLPRRSSQSVEDLIEGYVFDLAGYAEPVGECRGERPEGADRRQDRRSRRGRDHPRVTT